MEKYLADAFKQLDSLTEEVFEFNLDGIEKMKEFEEEPVEDEIEVIDIDANSEEEIEDSYVGKVILDCDVCHSKLFKDADLVIIDEESELANVGEECPYCTSNLGYKVVGQVAEYCDHCHDDEHSEEHDVEETETEEKVSVDAEKFQEGIKRARARKAGTERVAESKSRRIKEDKTSPRDRIDAHRDDRVERAKKAYDKARDDADAQRDDRLKRAGLKESDKPAAISIEDAQKWVDYDMKRYGKISDRTNRLVRKAGFQILKDNHGDYEVGAGKFEACDRGGKKLEEAPLYGLNPTYDSRKSFGGKAQVEIDSKGNETLYSYDTPVVKITKRGKVTLLPKWDSSQTTLRHVKEFLKQHDLKADSLAQIKKDYLKEDFERVDIETDREKMSMTADKDGRVTVTTEPKSEEREDGGEVIEPIDVETKTEIEMNTEESDDSVDFDIDEFGEEEFDELGESYLKKVYDNVQSYRTTSATAQKNGMKLEGLITFNSGKTKKTSFVFESKEADKNNRVKFIGENLQITRGKKAFTLVGSVQGKKLVSESLNYNYRTKNSDGKSQRVYGTIKK